MFTEFDSSFVGLKWNNPSIVCSHGVDNSGSCTGEFTRMLKSMSSDWRDDGRVGVTGSCPSSSSDEKGGIVATAVVFSFACSS